MTDCTSSTDSRKSVSFSFQRESSRPTPLHVKIGGGEKCLATLAQTLFDSLYKDPEYIVLYNNAQIEMDPNYYYRYILHITGKKPYDGELVRITQAKLGFRSKHYNLLMKYIAEAGALMGIPEGVIREILEAAITTKNDMKGHPLKGTISYW